MDEYHEMMRDGEALLERIGSRKAVTASRAAVRKAADDKRLLRGSTVDELRAELETSLNFIVAELEAVNARVAAPTGGDDADGEFPMLSEAVFSRYGLQDRVNILRALLRDLSKAVREQRKRIDALETRQTAADSNARRGIQ